VALRAALLDREEALLQADLAAALAGRTGFRLRARLGAGALAGLAGFHRRDADLGLGAEGGLFEGDLNVVAQVRTTIDVRPSAACAAAKNFVENSAKGVGESATAAKTAKAAAHAGLRINPGVAVLVVGSAFLRIGEDFVGFLRFLEVLFRLGIVRIAVRMVLHGQLAVGLLDFILGGVAVDAEDVI